MAENKLILGKNYIAFFLNFKKYWLNMQKYVNRNIKNSYKYGNFFLGGGIMKIS